MEVLGREGPVGSVSLSGGRVSPKLFASPKRTKKRRDRHEAGCQNDRRRRDRGVLLLQLDHPTAVEQPDRRAPTLSYFQAAGLWFLVSLLFAWVGIGVRSAFWVKRGRGKDWSALGDRIERKVRRLVSRWAEEDGGVDDLGDRVEAKIKRGFSRWVGVDEEIDWDDLGEHIERKIKQKVRDWAEEE